MDHSSSGRRTGSLAVTVGELLDAAERLPFRPVREALDDRPFIVVAPHPDDESLGCGGLIDAACREGLLGKVVIVSDGAGSHPNSKAFPPERLAHLREEEAIRATAALGFKPQDVLFLRLPDRFVPHQGEEAERAIAAIIDRVRAIGAGSLFVSWRHDPHCDHLASYQIARQVQMRADRLRLFEYVVWGHTLPPSTEVGAIHGGFKIHVDAEALERKRGAIVAHGSQTSDLINDDPAGFLFRQIDRGLFDRRYEFFLESPP
jgi:LmbE family N-acetylglucosaminyl deacetylase